jgi:hypothetical protein
VIVALANTTINWGNKIAKFAAPANTSIPSTLNLGNPRIPLPATIVDLAGTATNPTAIPTRCVKFAPTANTTMYWPLPSAKHVELESTTPTTAKWAKFPNPKPVPFVGPAGTTTDPTNRRKRLAKPVRMGSIWATKAEMFKNTTQKKIAKNAPRERTVLPVRHFAIDALPANEPY